MKNKISSKLIKHYYNAYATLTRTRLPVSSRMLRNPRTLGPVVDPQCGGGGAHGSPVEFLFSVSEQLSYIS